MTAHNKRHQQQSCWGCGMYELRAAVCLSVLLSSHLVLPAACRQIVEGTPAQSGDALIFHHTVPILSGLEAVLIRLRLAANRLGSLFACDCMQFTHSLLYTAEGKADRSSSLPHRAASRV